LPSLKNNLLSFDLLINDLLINDLLINGPPFAKLIPGSWVC